MIPRREVFFCLFSGGLLSETGRQECLPHLHTGFLRVYAYGCDGGVSGMIQRRELFFCLLSGRRIVRRADRNVRPTFKPASLECEYTCAG